MKKINFSVFYIASFLILILLIFNFFIIKNKKNDQFFNYKKINYSIAGKNYYLLVADTFEKRSKGLMNLEELKNYDGMIFIFKEKDFLTFWNKNTFLDLRVIWLDDDQVVGEDFLPSIKKSKEIVFIRSPKKVNKVVEIIK